MEALQWFCLGVLSMFAAVAMVYGHMVVKPKWYAMPTIVAGFVLVLFGIAWAGSSLIEGYPQSSALGLMFFTGPGLIIMILTWRYLVAPGLKKASLEK